MRMEINDNNLYNHDANYDKVPQDIAKDLLL